VVVTGGQADAHAPEHADVLPVSFAQTYTARPEPSVRTMPAEDEAVLMTMAVPLAEAPLEAGALLAEPAAAPVLLLVLEHAAASTATPTAPPTPAASLAGTGIRFTLEFHIVFFSRLARLCRASFDPPHGRRYRYGTKRQLGLEENR
jgi:hypothetical protein